MPTLRDEIARTAIIERVQKLTPNTPARWGNFNAPRMICHLNDALAVSVGEVPCRSMNRKAFQTFPLKHLILYVFPFPKGAKAPLEMLATSPTVFEADCRQLLKLVARIASAPDGTGPEHPLFGPLTTDEWNALHWKHIDHHLKQFGC
jgi:hypothetical protein